MEKMATKGSVPEFNTLKECLEFLYWLNDGKRGIVRNQVAGRLKRLLEKVYKNVNQNQIETALSQFLATVSNFYTKLCKSPEGRYTGERKTKPALNALLQCVPKVLAVTYFLRYNVDEKFAALGGGKWADDMVGQVVRMKGSNVDGYLTATSGAHSYGVIPGGFNKNELKFGYRDNGYPVGREMAKDLQNIGEKKERMQNYFLDVFSTTVLPTSGCDTSNIANALRLVRDFCRIFGEVTDVDDFKSHLYSRDKCIEWLELKDHCKKLIGPLDDIFKRGRFSFTGYGRNFDDLKNKTNLEEVKAKLAEIGSLSSIRNFNSKTLRRNKTLSPDIREELAKYFTSHLFRYGFTFEANAFKTDTTPYDDLKTYWDSAIADLKQTNGGLDKLKRILGGKLCKLTEDEEKDQEDPEPSDVELEDEEPKRIATKTEATKTEAAKPVVTKAEAAKPTKTEGAQNLGKKAEGAQNQGKKAEGAQNQGKKAEGNQIQENGQSVENIASSPVVEATQTQPQTLSTSDSQLPGAPSPGGGQGSNGQGSSPDVAQRSSQGTPKSHVADSTTSSAPGASSVGGEANVGGGSADQDSGNAHTTQQCKPGQTLTDGWKGGSKICIANERLRRANHWESEWTKANEAKKKEEEAAQKKKDAYEEYKRQMDQIPNYHLSLNGFETRAPFDGEVLPDTDSIMRQQQQGYTQLLMSKLDVSGDVLPAPIANPLTHVSLSKNYPRGHQINATEFQMEPVPHTPISDFAGRPVPYPKLIHPHSRAPTIHKPFLSPSEPIESYPPTSHPHDNSVTALDLSMSGSVIPMTPFPGVHNIELSLPQKPKVQVIPNPKQRSLLPPIALPEYSGHQYYIPSKYPFTAKVDDETIEKMLSLTGTPSELQTAQIVGDSNVATLAIPELTGNIISAFRQDPRTSRSPLTSKPDGDDDDDASVEYASAVTFNDNIMKTMAGVTGQPVVGVNGKVDISHIPSDSRLNDGDSYHLVGQEVQDDSTIKRRQQDLLNFQNEELKQDSQNAQRERELLTLKQESEHINEKQKKLMQAAQVEADRIHAFNDSKFGISLAPLRNDQIPFDVQIDVPKRPLQDSSYDLDIDDPYANADDIFMDEFRNGSSLYVEDKGFSSVPQTNFDLDFVPERIGLEGYDDPGMPRDPARKTDERVINPFSTHECRNPWSVSTSTSSTDTVQPPTSPPQALDHLPPPKTVREMLYWFVGFNQYGYIGIIREHVYSFLKRFKNDAIDVTLEPYTLDASLVTAKLTETCLYAANIIYKVRHNNDFEAISNFNFKSVYSQLRYSSDPACLLCQLRDYVYACCHQLEFLKAQCNKNSTYGGWQDCNYSSDTTASKSSLQGYLTDDWNSKFKTHPFDPCNLCLKSRIKMGLSTKDLPEKSQTGTTLSSILTPSCGGNDPLLTLSSYLNCLSKVHGHCL